MSKFKHDDDAERFMPAPDRRYENVDLSTCHVTPTRVSSVATHYRPTIVPTDDRYFALGIEREDAFCAHEAVELTRFGYARCAKCRGHLWCMAWVAEGLYALTSDADGDFGEADEEDAFDDSATIAWAEAWLRGLLERVPPLRLVSVGGRTV